ncbi:hypothetical protein A2372_00775 [Candidatus Wolfebacteria bacterium RIFOXYB1_FULL_54_12]|uniref:Uncharacterized protein n=1 Tax=Candidatus Wolfebacteria bacterium RIFOXYB1_FULL_54_12 TaxID=1802559 RepID=A0A1F8DY46_9BACT|nr:MAG: hypothetical protein A2372_00775 [Candidatus Wolfebacteria bacterium RIFOXYB1_FULL_54_12]
MALSKNVFWSRFILTMTLVLMVREVLVLIRGVTQPKTFAAVNGVLEFPVPQINTLSGWMLNYVGSAAVVGITYCTIKYIMDKKDVVLGIGGFAIGFSLLATGLAGSSLIIWLPVALAMGIATAYIAEKARTFPASGILSLEMGAIIGMTASVALDYGLFAAAAVEFWVSCLYWAGIIAVVLYFENKESRHDEDDGWEED